MKKKHARDCAVNWGFAENDINGECDCGAEDAQ